jgi:AcrR family transcriptional regulator
MFAALAEALSESGYVGTSVADIIRRAGVSRETFYQQFTSKQDCFVQGFDEQSRSLFRVAAEALPSGGTPVERFSVAVDAYLNALADAPELARLYLVEVYAAGPEMLHRRAEMQQAFVDGLAVTLGARTKRDRFACEALVAAITSLVTSRLVAGGPDDVRALRAPLATLAERIFS